MPLISRFKTDDHIIYNGGGPHRAASIGSRAIVTQPLHFFVDHVGNITTDQYITIKWIRDTEEEQFKVNGQCDGEYPEGEFYLDKDFYEIEAVFNSFWKEIIIKDGKVDLDQVKRELFDYHAIMEEVPKVYCEITGNKLSYPNYTAEAVLGLYREELQKDIDEAVQEKEDEMNDEIVSLKIQLKNLRRKLRGEKNARPKKNR